MPPKGSRKRRPSSPRQGKGGGGQARADNFFVKLFKLGILLGLWVAIAGGFFVAYCALDLPDIHQVVQAKRRPSVVLQTDDGTVFARYGDMVGEHVTMDDVPPYLPQAIIAIEDRRFYKHSGVDVIGIMRAFARNILAGHLVQGGSTLTQQLAKNLFLSPERTAKRKVQEMLLALWMERTYDKQQILTAYMNRVYLGNGAYGVDAAAHAYFDKAAHDLTLREAATIAGLLRAPSKLAPSHDAAAALERAKLVLQAMVEEGYITDKQRKDALAHIPPPDRKPGMGGDGHYFADWVMEQVEPMVETASQDLVVSTTLDLKLQRAAERHIDTILSQGGHDVSQAALVTMGYDGAIRALVGGRDYHQSQFNRATQAMRQPGSSFKPIVYLAAIEQGLRPDDTLLDAPITLGHWSPENFEEKYRGNVTAREALAESINTVAVRVFMKVGADHVIATARALGITSPLEHDPALALGASEVTPLEMTGVYASLSAGGKAVAPYAIKEVRSTHGDIIYAHGDAAMPQTVSESAVSTLVDMMTEVVKSGTGKKAALGDRPVAGKTGTSSDYRDAWFIGFTGDYTTGVWLGNDDNHPMRKIVGGSLPAQLWHDYMTEAEKDLPARDLLSGPSTSGGVSAEESKGFSDFINGILGGN